MTLKEIGILGEKIALNYLKNKGYKILEQNYFPFSKWGKKQGEIDIVCQKSRIIIFIEVKTLLGDSLQPEEKVNFKKQRQIIKLAQKYLLEKKFSRNIKWKIDVIAIKIDIDSKKARIKHFENISV